jgi:hypothetical protein
MLIKLSNDAIINILQIIDISSVKLFCEKSDKYYFGIGTTKVDCDYTLIHDTKEAAEAEREKILKIGDSLLVWVANAHQLRA